MTRQQADEKFLGRCLELALMARDRDEVPVGALIVDHETNQIIAEAYNLRETLNSPLAHAEIMAIHRACKKLGRWRLSGHTLYSSLEPCVMCSGVIIQARLDRVVFAAQDPKGGGQTLFGILANEQLNHQADFYFAEKNLESSQILKEFFRAKRK